MDSGENAVDRASLEALIAADLRELAAESDQVGRLFATSHDVRPTDLRALLHIMVAEDAGQPISSGELRKRMGLSAPAITYLVDRMIDSGHLRRQPHSADRRKVILRYDEAGLDVARAFFTPLADHIRAALSDSADADLTTAHRVFTDLLAAMRGFQAELDVAKD